MKIFVKVAKIVLIIFFLFDCLDYTVFKYIEYIGLESNKVVSD